MNKIFKITKLLFFLLFLYSCGSVGEALQGKKRSDQGDEFLIDKKNPLARPPDFDKLPKPGEANIDSTKDIVSNHLYVGSYLSLAVLTFLPSIFFLFYKNTKKIEINI